MTPPDYRMLQFDDENTRAATVPPMPPAAPPPVVRLDDVSFVRNDARLLDGISWAVRPGENWLVLGANGSGKTTLLRIAALYEHPTSGVVEVLGERLGRTDVRSLRRRIGYASAALAQQLRPESVARDVVMTARNAALEPWWHRYDDNDRARAVECLARLRVEHLAHRSLATLSSGEQQRVLLARTLMNDPGVVLLDEPSARLDLGGREQLVAALDEMMNTVGAPPLVLVTHHVDEVPSSITHALLLRDGSVLASGPVDEVMTAESLSACFGVALHLERRADGRWSAWSRQQPPVRSDD
jgi:iron complex transport system ATP-binding protein